MVGTEFVSERERDPSSSEGARDQVNPGRWGRGGNRSTMPLRDTVRKELVDLTRLEGLMADYGGRDMLDVSKGMFLFEPDISGGFDSREVERSPTLASSRMRQILRRLRRDSECCNVSSSDSDSKRTKTPSPRILILVWGVRSRCRCPIAKACFFLLQVCCRIDPVFRFGLVSCQARA